MTIHSSIDGHLSASDSIACIRDLLNTTLQIIDEMGLPSDIGAHLDLAICRVESLIGGEQGMATPFAI